MDLVRIDAFTLHGHSEYGEWFCEELDEWHDTPAYRSQSSDLQGQDGGTVVDEYLSSRTPTVTTTLFARSRQDLLHARDKLSVLATGNRTVRMEVTDAGVTTWADVRARGGVKMKALSPTVARFQVPVRAADPRRFGEEHTFTNQVGTASQVFHHGTYDGPLMLRVSGNGLLPDGYVVFGPGSRRLRVTRPLQGDHVLNLETGVLTVGGQAYFGDVLASQADTWPAPPGPPVAMNVLPWPYESTSTATYTFSTFDAYI